MSTADETLSLSVAQRQALDSAGEQWTPLREQVFLALAAQPKPASAYDIADSVSRTLGRRIAPNTVYRMLDLFVQANLATRIESRNAYLASAHPQHRHDCIFLVCVQCGETRHLDDDTLTDALRARAAAQGYTALKPVLEVIGLCAACAAA